MERRRLKPELKRKPPPKSNLRPGIQRNEFGERTNGRKKGSIRAKQHHEILLEKALIKAGSETGSDGVGKEGLLGYCKFLARRYPKTFATLLGKVLPLQVNMQVSQEPVRKITREMSEAEANAAFADTLAIAGASPSIKLVAELRGGEEVYVPVKDAEEDGED